MRVGFTVTRKIGGAVVRNRMKRRFRALAREVLPGKGIPGADHVMIGRAKGIERDFGLLRSELVGALENHTVGSRVHGTLQGRDDWGAYTVDEAAMQHGAGVEEQTNDAAVAYARFPDLEPTRYRDGWLPD